MEYCAGQEPQGEVMPAKETRQKHQGMVISPKSDLGKSLDLEESPFPVEEFNRMNINDNSTTLTSAHT